MCVAFPIELFSQSWWAITQVGRAVEVMFVNATSMHKTHKQLKSSQMSVMEVESSKFQVIIHSIEIGQNTPTKTKHIC